MRYTLLKLQAQTGAEKENHRYPKAYAIRKRTSLHNWIMHETNETENQLFLIVGDTAAQTDLEFRIKRMKKVGILSNIV